MNDDLISRSALKKVMEEERQYLLARGQIGAEHILVHHCLPIIDNAPAVELTSDIRWTDKLSVISNGDIIDFEGRVVGHINLDSMGGSEDEIN